MTNVSDDDFPEESPKDSFSEGSNRETHSLSKAMNVTLGGQAVKALIQVVTTITLARILNPSDYGAFAMVVAITGFGTLIGDLGLSTAAIQAKVITQQQKSNLFWVSFMLGLVLCGVGFTASGLLASYYQTPIVKPLVQLVSINFIIRGFSGQFSAQLSRNLRFGILAVSDISAQVAGLAIAIPMGILGMGPWALAYQSLAVSLVTLLTIIVPAHWWPSLPRRAPMKGLLFFGGSSFGVQALTYITSNLDSVMLGRYLGATALGLYDRGYQLFRMPVQQIASPLTRVALPTLARVQDSSEKFERYLCAAQIGVTGIIGALFSLLAALATPIVVLLYGEQWVQVGPILSVLAIGGLFQMMSYVYYWGFLGLGKSAVQFRYSIVTRIQMVLIIVIWGRTGLIEMACAVTISLAFNWVVLAFFAWPKTGHRMNRVHLVAIRAIIVHILVGGLVFGVDYVIASDWTVFLRLLLGFAVAVAGYSIGLLAVPSLRNDICDARKVMKEKII